MAALMPPAAATECERTGWTLLITATLAPACAAASAARWPARPAPIMRMSCEGMRQAPGRDLGIDALLAHHAEEMARGVHHREPLPVVAREELLVGVEQCHPGGDRHRLGVHHVGHREGLDAPPQRPLEHRRARGL